MIKQCSVVVYTDVIVFIMHFAYNNTYVLLCMYVCDLSFCPMTLCVSSTP